MKYGSWVWPIIIFKNNEVPYHLTLPPASAKIVKSWVNLMNNLPENVIEKKKQKTSVIVAGKKKTQTEWK